MRKLFITLSVLSAIGGFAAAVLIFVLGLVLGFDNDKYGKVPLPGEGRVTLPRGDVTVYYEERNSFPSGLLSYTVRSADTRRPVPSRPSGSGRSRVRRIRLSESRSITWLNADAPPATRAVPMIVESRAATFEVSPCAIA